MRFGLKERYTVVGTKLGWMVLCGSEKGISLITLPRLTLEAALTGLDGYTAKAVEDAAVFGDLPLRLQRYFDGEKVTFTDALDLEGVTAFERAVWGATRSIPYGEVRSYGWVANRIGKPLASRAVGRAMARNRFPIVVPCHRVVAGDGSLGGFSGGLELKRSLLDMEAGGVQG
jgi:methylated-DNA-[protein]-cysteine S-methyltransferase